MTQPLGILGRLMCPGSYPLKRFVFWAHLNDVVKMKDSQGNKSFNWRPCKGTLEF